MNGVDHRALSQKSCNARRQCGHTDAITKLKPPNEQRFCARREGTGLLVSHMDRRDFIAIDGANDAVERAADDPAAPLYAAHPWRRGQYIGRPLTHRGYSPAARPCPCTVELPRASSRSSLGRFTIS